jgi:hypothetical protein
MYINYQRNVQRMEAATIIRAEWWDNFNYELYINYLKAKLENERKLQGFQK